jgi:hypothetical protein
MLRVAVLRRNRTLRLQPKPRAEHDRKTLRVAAMPQHIARHAANHPRKKKKKHHRHDEDLDTAPLPPPLPPLPTRL